MFYKIELDLFSEMEDEENPKFYLTEDELKSFMNLCFKNKFELKISTICESEYQAAIG